MRVGVVGASGFVGSAVASELDSQGVEVVRIKSPRFPPVRPGDLARSIQKTQLEDELYTVIGSLDVLVNAAGISDSGSVNEAELFAANALLPGVLAKASKELGVRRFVHVSSAAVQGDRETLDSSREYRGFSPYARSKIGGEQAVLGERPEGSVVYRPGGVHGPTRRVTQQISRLARSPFAFIPAGQPSPTPQLTVQELATAVTELALCNEIPPSIVHHPWTGITAADVLEMLGGVRPRRLPRWMCRVLLSVTASVSSLIPSLKPMDRRLQVLWLGQSQAPSWFERGSANHRFDRGLWRTVGADIRRIELSRNGMQPLPTSAATARITQENRFSSKAVSERLKGCRRLRDASRHGTAQGTLEGKEFKPSGLHARRALIVATVPDHIRAFHIPHIEALKADGWEVDVAASGDSPIVGATKRFSVPFSRSPLDWANLRSFREMQRILRENQYDVMHVHTPVASAVARLAAIGQRRRGTKVIYTAHGFHFFKGSGPVGWLLYYPIEKALARVTDVILTINKEDYGTAKRKFRTDVCLIPGVGVDPSRFFPADGIDRRLFDRLSIGIPENSIVGISVGELNRNKNHSVLLRALAKVVEDGFDLHLLIVGDGPLKEELCHEAKALGESSRVHLLGRRENVVDLLQLADVFLAPSFREGLPSSVIESQMVGLPVIASDNRGHRELIVDGVTGLLIAGNATRDWVVAIESTITDRDRALSMADRAQSDTAGRTLEVSLRVMMQIYDEAIS